MKFILLKEVFPLIRKHFVDAQCIIAGAICQMIINDDLGEGVKLIGYVDSPNALYEQGDVLLIQLIRVQD